MPSESGPKADVREEKGMVPEWRSCRETMVGEAFLGGAMPVGYELILGGSVSRVRVCVYSLPEDLKDSVKTFLLPLPRPYRRRGMQRRGRSEKASQPVNCEGDVDSGAFRSTVAQGERVCKASNHLRDFAKQQLDFLLKAARRGQAA